MQVTKLQTIDFQGLSGRKDIVFNGKVAAFSMPNGSGKTSVLNAVRFALTGEAVGGFPIHGNAPKCDVGLTLSDGTSIIREQQADGPGKQWYNKHAIEKKALTQVIQNKCGMSTKTIRTLSASELLASMKPQELSDLMLSYVPERLDVAMLASYIPGITPGMQKIMTDMLPSQDFGMDTLDAFYSKIYDMRRDAKKSKIALESAVRTLSGAEKPEETKAELQAKLQAAKKLSAEKAAYQAKLDAYKKAKALYDAQNAEVQKLGVELASLPDEEFSQAMLDKAVADADAKRNEFEETKRVIQTLKGNFASLDKAVQTLDQPICPLSNKLKCTTDKSPIRDELVASMESTKQEIEAQEAKMKVQLSRLTDLQEAVKKLRIAESAAVRKKSLQERMFNLQKSIAALSVQEPEAPKLEEGGLDETAVMKKLQQIDMYEKCETQRQELDRVATEVDDLDKLVKVFAPKGVIRDSVMASYIKAFESHVNTKAEKLKHGMRMKFSAGNGVIPMLDVNGTGMYYPYSSLSGGEQVYMLFLLLDMFNSICGLKMLFLDELSVLDESAFEALLQVINDHTDEYDQVFLATVNHPELETALKKSGVQVFTSL